MINPMFLEYPKGHPSI